EENAESHELYIRNLRQLLSGEPVQDTGLEQQPALDSVVTVARIVEDEMLRKETDLDAQLSTNIFRRNVSAASRPVTQLHLVPPVSGSISLGFDPHKNHLGVDINAPVNTAIKSIQDGYIISAGWTLETGNTIGIQHENNMISFYKHNSALLKKTNSFVRAGEAVAIIGNTGTLSTGPHLHFELWLNGKPTDPTRYINFN
ncbi:MAG: M23 family metallopeptidase, partial [Saprospiraceae bacterium]|nr:M23 family metallopeptidase [Saprospiraceae bacterium]